MPSDFGPTVSVGHAWNSIPARVWNSHTFGSFKKTPEEIFVGEEWMSDTFSRYFSVKLDFIGLV